MAHAPAPAARPPLPPLAGRPAPAARRELELVVNGRASGAGRAAADRARAALTAAGACVRVHVTADVGELAEALADADAGERRVVLVGGDGTVHAVANLPRAARPPLALLPAGRANNIARALGVPLDWAAAARLAVTGRPVAVDALRVTTPARTLIAVEGVSAGFHAAARHRYTGENSADLAAGVRALTAELLVHAERPVVLDADGRPAFAGAAAQVFLANLPLFGFGFRVAPDADPRDGRLEALVLRAPRRRDVVRLLAAARRGDHAGRPGVVALRATEAELRSALPLVADAEPLGSTTATVAAVPGHLRLIAGGAR